MAHGTWQGKFETGPNSPAFMITVTFGLHAKSDRDHGCGASGGWQNKSPDPASQAPRLVIEQTADL